MPTYENIFLRTTPAIHNALKDRAANSRVSMNQTIIELLTGIDPVPIVGEVPTQGSPRRDVILRVPSPVKSALRELASGKPLTDLIHAILTGGHPPVSV